MEYKGYILDETGDAPLADAIVTLVDANNKIILDKNNNRYSVVTDSTGKYIVNPPVQGKLQITHSIYLPQVINFGANAVMIGSKIPKQKPVTIKDEKEDTSPPEKSTFKDKIKGIKEGTTEKQKNAIVILGIVLGVSLLGTIGYFIFKKKST